MKILIANTILYCRNWDATRHFYREVLELTPSHEQEDWFIEFRLNERAHLSIADASRCTIEPGDGRGLTLSFFVKDLDEAHAHFAHHGLEPGPIKDRHNWRAPYFFIRDPENNRIEFWSNRRGAGVQEDAR